jgi:enoyl-CoA hydratase/carnithine racemase
MLLGEEIDAARAHELGIVNRLAGTAEEALAEAIGLAERLATPIPAVMTMAKDLINRGEATTLEDSLRIEALAQAIALGTDETLGAMRAFLDKAAR